ncbi:MAG: lanthionine synthetase C family protein, partial [Gaiellales bacterium]
MSDLFDAPSHEPPAGDPWTERAARAAISEIVSDAEQAFDPAGLWPAHPLDEDGERLPPQTALYMGAAGVVWALDWLQRAGLVSLSRGWA